jgi:hypothetical protein
MECAASIKFNYFERTALEGSNHVTTVGRSKGRARPDGKVHDTEWVHVCVLDSESKISRWLGTEDTAARLDK